MEELRPKLASDMPSRLFRDVMDLLASEKACSREGNTVRLPEHKVQLGDTERSLSETITAVLRKKPLTPPDLKDIEKIAGVERSKFTEVIRVLERQGDIVRVTSELYYLRDAIDSIKADLYKYFQSHDEITAATFRDILKSSRKYTIALLEHFDRTGITVRVGDARRLKSSNSGH